MLTRRVEGLWGRKGEAEGKWSVWGGGGGLDGEGPGGGEWGGGGEWV